MSFKDKYKKQYEDWTNKFSHAKDYLKTRNNDKYLIECAAQHPLLQGKYPGEEFTKRLDLAVNLYNKLKNEGKVVKIYVPGSRHMEKEIKDTVSLSLSGKLYLIEKGIPAKDIYSVATNLKYKGLAGVYNSADECYVASQIFKDDHFDRLISITSPAQMYRKTLFFIEFGVIPLNYSAPTDNLYHNYIDEIFDAIPSVIMKDNSLQKDDSFIAIKNRNDRCPYLLKKIENISEMKEDNFNKEEYQIDLKELELENKLNND